MLSSDDDARVDAAVNLVRAEVPHMSDESFRAGRERLRAAMAGSGGPRAAGRGDVVPLRGFRKRTVRMAAAAAIAAVVSGIVIIPASAPDSSLPLAAAAPLLDKAANMTIRFTPDLVVGPGQYRLVQEHSMRVGSYEEVGEANAYMSEDWIDTWIPADQSQQWRRTMTFNPEPKMFFGDKAKALENLAKQRKDWEGTKQAAGGNFYGRPDTATPQVDFEDPKYLATLPTDPHQLYLALESYWRPDLPGADERVMASASVALASGLMSAKARASMYRALTYLKGLEIVEQVANLDGRKGVAFGLRPGTNYVDEEWQLIIDPATGQFIGDRTVTTRDSGGLRAGTVTSSSSVESKVVNAMGATS